MNTQIFTEPMDYALAAHIIKRGGLLAFPTETVYGLGADGLNSRAVERIFEVKGRPNDNPLILHVADFDSLLKLTCETCLILEKVASAFMPGALTVIVKKRASIPDSVTAGLDTVAVRIPKNPIALRLMKECGVPIAAPSANVSGRPSPTCASHVIEDLGGKIEGIIDGGKCEIGVESTILDLTTYVPTVLRLGGVNLEELRNVLGDVIAPNTEVKGAPKAPGMKYRHYAPKAPLYIVENDWESAVDWAKAKCVKVGALTVGGQSCEGCVTIDLGNEAHEYAANLFAALREFDKIGVDIILTPKICEEGIGAAVNNRLMKASAKDIEVVNMEAVHAEDCVRLLNEYISNKWTIDSIKSDINLVALEGVKVVGFTNAKVAYDTVDLLNLVVDGECRRRGIAREMMRRLIEITGNKQILLEVRKSNDGAINFYKKMGFIVFGERKKYYNNDESAVIMKNESFSDRDIL